MNKKSKEIVKKLCFTLVIVISIITIIGCPNTVSNKTESGTEQNKPNPPTPPLPTDPNDWSGLNADQVILRMEINGDDDPIVTDYRGLGFGKKDSDGNFSYLYFDDSNVEIKVFQDYLNIGTGNMLTKTINEMVPTFNNLVKSSYHGDVIKPSKTISDMLGERWKAARYTDNSPGYGWLSFYDHSSSLIGTSGCVGYYNFANLRECFAVDKDMNIFYSNADTPPATHFADWHLVFVPKDDAPKDLKSYSFHYGPYTLRNVNKKKGDPTYPEGTYEKKYNLVVRTFTLSGMLEDTLGKHKVKEHLAAVLEDFPPFKYNGNYDVYLVFGIFFRGGDPHYSVFSGYSFDDYSFRNILKLNEEEFWKRCWTSW